MNKFNNVVFVGATSAIAYEVLKRILSKNNTNVVLVGRDSTKLKILESDLIVRGCHTVKAIECDDFNNPIKIQGTINQIELNVIDLVFIAHGNLYDQDACQNSIYEQNQSILINAVSPVLFLECFAKRLELQGFGTIAICGSVAGDRARKSNYCYGSSKAFVDSYANGLMHRLAKSDVRVCVIKPGPTDTPMTRGNVKPQVKLSKVSDVAADIVDGLCSGKHIIYAPKIWRFIMLVIRNIPRNIFLKLDI